MMAVVLADLVDRHDLRMIEVRGRLGFKAKPLEVVGCRESTGADHLECQHAIQADLPRLVDDAHPSLGDDLDQLVIAEVADARSGQVAANPRRPAAGLCWPGISTGCSVFTPLDGQEREPRRASRRGRRRQRQARSDRSG